MPTYKGVKKTMPKKSTKKPVKIQIKKKTVSKSVKKTEETPKNIVVKKVVKDEKEKIKEATTPTQLKVSGWKKKLKAEKTRLQPRVLRPKEELWEKKKKEKKTKRRKGLIILLDGLGKTGKTNFGLTAVDFKGFEGKRRIIPKGSPVYVLDTENAVEDEADFNFAEAMDSDEIIIENCFVEHPVTKEIDPSASLEKLEEWAYSLSDVKQGTLIIDNFTDYCEWAYYKLVDKVLGIGFDEDGKEKKAPMPIQYKWRTKKVKSFLRKLRNIGINVILVAQTKDEWVNEGGGALGGRKTGLQETDALKGTDYWVDIIARYEKEQHDDGSVTRRIVVLDSRFETEDMLDRDYIIEGNPTFASIVELFKDLL